jgi:ketosteroid isomerase-like protein
MTLEPAQQAIIDRYFEAMQAGLPAAAAYAALFADDAILVEPFSGQPRTSTGPAAIRASFEESVRNRPTNMSLTVDVIGSEGDVIRSDWTVSSPVLPGPMRGYDLCTIRDGKIARLEVHLARPPRS